MLKTTQRNLVNNQKKKPFLSRKKVGWNNNYIAPERIVMWTLKVFVWINFEWELHELVTSIFE